MQCINLFDTLVFEDAAKIDLIADANIPVEENLVYKAALLMKNYSSYKRGARIILKKEIPVAAGLGGGSSDAAITLKGLNRLWGLKLKNKDLKRLAIEIGSDVPFFLGGPVSLVQGRGEKVNNLKLSSSVAMLLVKPDISIPTSWAYSSYKTALTKKHIDIKLFCQTLDRKDLASLRHMIFNDLERPVIKKYRVVEDIKKTLTSNGAVISSMSGSGPAVYGVFSSPEEAVRASTKMGDHWCRVMRTLSLNAKWEVGNEN
jgi:4-diphosphocytidyl-2-C-methyl-D-erythritol kinase